MMSERGLPKIVPAVRSGQVLDYVLTAIDEVKIALHYYGPTKTVMHAEQLRVKANGVKFWRALRLDDGPVIRAAARENLKLSKVKDANADG